jgi:hypothetical protein
MSTVELIARALLVLFAWTFVAGVVASAFLSRLPRTEDDPVEGEGLIEGFIANHAAEQ